MSGGCLIIQCPVRNLSKSKSNVIFYSRDELVGTKFMYINAHVDT